MSKIFGIGLNKTGTTTLGQCFRLLGYHHTSCSRPLLIDTVVKKDPGNVFKTADEYDSFEDWPWPLLYRELDERYPGSKFILTVRRDENAWMGSLKKHALTTEPFNHCRNFAYGYQYPFGHEKEHIEYYNQHNSEVKTYFKNRPDDFITLCWENGHGWKELCQFLGRSVPDVPFPHENKSGSGDRNIRSLGIGLINRLISLVS